MNYPASNTAPKKLLHKSYGNKDTVQTITSYIKHRKVPKKFKDLPLDPNEAITELCYMLSDLDKKDLADAERKKRTKDIVTEIYLRVFFLLPYHTKRSAGNLFMRLHHSVFEDALQNMSLNILSAINKFDPDRATKFSNYILMYLKEALYKAIKNCTVVSPKNFRKSAAGLLEVEDDTDSCIDPPDTFSIATSKIKMGVVGSNKQYVYTDNGASYLVEMSYYDEAKDCVDSLYEEEMILWLRHAVDPKNKVLTEDEAIIVKHHFGIFGCPKLRLKDLAEIRKTYGKGHATTRISQIEQAAIKKLKKYFTSVGLEYFPA